MNQAESEKTPCEVCGQPSKWILKRRLNSPGFPGCTTVNTDAPPHPLCAEHSRGADAYALDGRKFSPSRPV